ncbi:hypothetical protein [Streptomyces phaeoluteigriseus]
MSTTQNVSLQVYAPDGTPISPAVSREHLLDLARGAYERAGTHLERGDIDIELAEVADKAACSLLRDRWNDDFPIAAYVELLTAVAALRAVFGFDPTPTAREVTDWSEKLGEHLVGLGQVRCGVGMSWWQVGQVPVQRARSVCSSRTTW